MLATLAVLALMLVAATTGASYYGYLGDDEGNPFLADGRWTSDAYNQVIHEQKNGNEFLAEDVNNKKFLKAGGADISRLKSKYRQNSMTNFQHPNDRKTTSTKAKEAKNKKPKNKKPKNSKLKPNNLDPHQATNSPSHRDDDTHLKTQKIRLDDRIKFLQSLDKTAGRGRAKFFPQNHQHQQGLQDFSYYPPPPYADLPPYASSLPYHHHHHHHHRPPPPLPLPLLPPRYPPHRRRLLLHPNQFSRDHHHDDLFLRGNQFSAQEGDQISMALVKAITDYLKVTGDAKGLTRVVQALTAFNEIFTSPTYYGPLMDGYKKFLEKISAHSFLQSLNEGRQMNIPGIHEKKRKMEVFQPTGEQQKWINKKNTLNNDNDKTLAKMASTSTEPPPLMMMMMMKPSSSVSSVAGGGSYSSTERYTVTPGAGKENKSR